MVFKNDDLETEYSLNLEPTTNKTIFKTNTLINEGINLEELKQGEYLLLLKSKKNDKVHCLITNAGKITPSVSFRRPSISITSANYFFDECSCGKKNNPVESLRITLKTSENVLENILGNATRQNERSISNTKDKKMDFER